MQNRGVLTKWNDDRGFGFIKHSETEMIFLHISAVKMMPRRPEEGDVLIYDITVDTSGKKKAACVSIQGLQKISLQTRKQSKNGMSGGINFSFVSAIIIVGALLFYFRNNLGISNENGFSQSAVSEILQTIKSDNSASNFTCQGKTYCSEMTSCEEAKFYLNNCPNQNTDGDGDGDPCESQWCK